MRATIEHDLPPLAAAVQRHRRGDLTTLFRVRRLVPTVLLALALLVVAAPRFDQRDVGPLAAVTGTEQGANLGDAEHYVRYVEALRGDAGGLPPAPFRYRPLTPVLAAPLPVGALTAINIVNVLALAVAAIGLWMMLRLLELSERQSDLGCLLFIVSFPTAYYGTIGYVDPLAVAIIMLGVWALLADRRLLVLVLLILGALARESTVVLAALGVIWLATQSRGPRVLLWSLGWIGAFVATIVTVRVMLNGAGTNLWRPSIDRAIDNLSRPRTWSSAALTLGVPAVLIAARLPELRRLRRDRLVFFGAGAVLCLGVFGYALLAAYADGRFIWPIYAFTVPITLLLYAQPPRAVAPCVDTAPVGPQPCP